MFILPYQTGVIIIGTDPNREYYGWWTDNQNDMVLVQDFQKVIPLFLSSWVFWHYVYSMVFSLVALALERFCATYFIEDYENVRRRYIPYLLIVFTNLITILYSYLIVNNMIPFWIAFAQCVINGSFVFFGYLAFWRINVHLKNRIVRRRMNKKQEYSLTRKFQIEENIRSFKLAIKMVFAAVIYLSISLLILLCLIFELFRGYEHVFAHIFDNIVLAAALILSLTLLSCSPSWSESFMRGLPIIGRYRSPRVGHFNFPPETSISESDVYFKQLKHAWL